ncbi:class I SAM-dependent methyltransferase [Lacrimispora sp.]|uniref:class I SAM-dependent methyltransferase n=1 Tax=Lacrimispora sp. TaxID=2719234 RepID=UPI003991CB21
MHKTLLNESVVLENMSDFFAARVDVYDEHMQTNVRGCKEAYRKMAALIPYPCEQLLDLGCGTGLELELIFELFPNIHVTGIDLTQAMLLKLKEKYPGKSLRLICGDYFAVDFGGLSYDCAVSFQTLHHFSHKEKIGLYKKIYNSLACGGTYIECDYMVETQEEEDFHFAEYDRLREKNGISKEKYYHYDTPCTVDNQMKMLKCAGFKDIQKVFRMGNTTIITAKN